MLDEIDPKKMTHQAIRESIEYYREKFHDLYESVYAECKVRPKHRQKLFSPTMVVEDAQEFLTELRIQAKVIEDGRKVPA